MECKFSGVSEKSVLERSTLLNENFSSLAPCLQYHIDEVQVAWIQHADGSRLWPWPCAMVDVDRILANLA